MAGAEQEQVTNPNAPAGANNTSASASNSAGATGTPPAAQGVSPPAAAPEASAPLASPPAPEGAEGHDGAAGAAGGAPQAGAKDAPAGPGGPGGDDWKMARIRVLSAKLAEAKAEAEANKASPDGAAPAGTITLTQAELDRRIAEAAQAKQAIDKFNDEANRVALAGQGKYGAAEFNGRVGNLVGNFVDRNDPVSLNHYNMFLMAALKTGKAEELIYELGGNLNEANRILSLSPVDMAIELTKKALTPREAAPQAPAGEPQQLSNAPAPPSVTVGNRNAPHNPISASDPTRADKLGKNEWFRRREAEIAERQKQMAS